MCARAHTDTCHNRHTGRHTHQTSAAVPQASKKHPGRIQNPPNASITQESAIECGINEINSDDRPARWEIEAHCVFVPTTTPTPLSSPATHRPVSNKPMQRAPRQQPGPKGTPIKPWQLAAGGRTTRRRATTARQPPPQGGAAAAQCACRCVRKHGEAPAQSTPAPPRFLKTLTLNTHTLVLVHRGCPADRLRAGRRQAGAAAVGKRQTARCSKRSLGGVWRVRACPA